MSKIIDDPELNKSLCQGCSKCCEYINILIKEPKTKRAIDKIVWFLLHGISIHIDREGEWMVHISNRCKALDEYGRCKEYSTRPTICREHSQTQCDKNDKEQFEEHIFNNEKEFLGFVLANPKLKNIYNKKVKRPPSSKHE
jgi:uncharacterized protein